MLLSLEARPDIWRDLQVHFPFFLFTNAQFTHIAQFPKTECESCHARLCFQCGESTWHIGMSCHDYISKTISGTCELRVDTSPERISPDRVSDASSTLPTPATTNGWVRNDDGKWEIQHPHTPQSAPRVDPDAMQNLKWKLENTKACPRCCILIHREEGCNKGTLLWGGVDGSGLHNVRKQILLDMSGTMERQVRVLQMSFGTRHAHADCRAESRRVGFVV
jgi:hypothetical protein